MAQREPKALLLLLTPTCIRALESAVVTAVNRRHQEVTTGHFLLAALADGGSDVARMLGAQALDVAATQEALVAALGELPGHHGGRPSLAPDLLQLIEDAWDELSWPRMEKRVRSGVMLVQLTRGAARLGEGPLSSLVQGLARVIDARSLATLGRARESAECRAEPSDPASPRLPREIVECEVAPRETLIDIARRFAVDVEDVARDNGVGLHDPLPPGATLRLRVLPQGKVPTVAPQAPGRGERRVDYRVEKECSARSLVARVIHFMRMTPERSRRDEASLRDNPPRYYRMKQIEALLAAFDIAPPSAAAASEIVLALSETLFKTWDPETHSLQGVTGMDYLRRLGPIELFIDGYFLLARPPAELASVARRLRPYWPPRWPSHVPMVSGEPVLTGADLRVVWERAFRFRRDAEGLVDFNGGVYEASGWHGCAVELAESMSRGVYDTVRDLDDLLADIVDPRRRVFSREELIQSFGFPDVDLFDIDCEWA